MKISLRPRESFAAVVVALGGAAALHHALLCDADFVPSRTRRHAIYRAATAAPAPRTVAFQPVAQVCSTTFSSI